MFENALTGSRRYWTWIFFVLGAIALGTGFYFRQLVLGLTVTNMSRGVPWGFYIAQFTFLVGVAASAVMVVLPYYLHNFKAFGKLAVLGEFLAISAVTMCTLFIFVDMGRPDRVTNVMLHPTLNSMMFWDMLSLTGYLLLNILVSRITFSAERRGVAPPKWIKFFIIASIPWAVSIHTVTAFLYAGLAARPFWMTAVLAPRFLASAFAGGPALLILLCLLTRKLTGYDVGRQAIRMLGKIVAYAMSISVFLLLLEFFTAFYSGIPEHLHHFEFLYLGLDGNTTLVPWMWLAACLSIISLVLLLVPRFRAREGLLAFACVTVFGAIWIEKGLGMVITGFIPTSLGDVPYYLPSMGELFVSLGVYGIGALILTGLYKIAITVRQREPEPTLAAEPTTTAPAPAAGD